MTQTKIEKRKPLWPWILAGLAIVALLVYFFRLNDNKEVVKEKPVTDLISVKENNSTVGDFINFIEKDSTDKMTLGHGYTSNALIKLTDAVNAMAHEAGYNVSTDLDSAKEYAAKITADPSSTAHADDIRKAAAILTDDLQNIQQALYPGLSSELAELRNASDSINPDVLTLNQKETIKSFFNKAADLLQKMN